MEPTGNRLRRQSALSYGGTIAGSLLEIHGAVVGHRARPRGKEGARVDVPRHARAERCIAVVPDQVAADVAQTRYDQVVWRVIEDAPAEVAADVDLIVLGGLPRTSRGANRRCCGGSGEAAPKRSRLVVSLPNLRVLGLVLPLLPPGTEYSDGGGNMDRDHVRWFTRSSLEHLLTSCGWAPMERSGESGAGMRATLNRLSGRRFGELFGQRLFVKALRSPAT